MCFSSYWGNGDLVGVSIKGVVHSENSGLVLLEVWVCSRCVFHVSAVYWYNFVKSKKLKVMSGTLSYYSARF